MIRKAEIQSYQTEGIIGQSVNKLLIGKTFWKSIATPQFLQNIGIIPFTDKEIDKFQKIENNVFRKLTGGKASTPIATLRGEIGASAMKTRFVETKILMIKSILEGENSLTKNILDKVRKEKANKWKMQIDKHLKELNIKYEEIETQKRTKIKSKVREWDTKNWKRDIENKSSISIYRTFKKEIREEKCYDNRPESNLLFQARTNTLDLNTRNRFKKEDEKDTRCKLCGKENENLIHFLIECKEMEKVRDKELMKKYQEENMETMTGNILFNMENIEETKIMLGKMWKYRKERIIEKEKEEKEEKNKNE